jgi:TRAP-type uncharacterized transport system substrate-binding protein
MDKSTSRLPAAAGLEVTVRTDAAGVDRPVAARKALDRVGLRRHGLELDEVVGGLEDGSIDGGLGHAGSPPSYRSILAASAAHPHAAAHSHEQKNDLKEKRSRPRT